MEARGQRPRGVPPSNDAGPRDPLNKISARLLAAEIVRRNLLRDLRSLEAQIRQLLAEFWGLQGVFPGGLVEHDGRLWVIRELLLDEVLARAPSGRPPDNARAANPTGDTSRRSRSRTRRRGPFIGPPWDVYEPIDAWGLRPAPRGSTADTRESTRGADAVGEFFDLPPVRASVRGRGCAGQTHILMRYTPLNTTSRHGPRDDANEEVGKAASAPAETVADPRVRTRPISPACQTRPQENAECPGEARDPWMHDAVDGAKPP